MPGVPELCAHRKIANSIPRELGYLRPSRVRSRANGTAVSYDGGVDTIGGSAGSGNGSGSSGGSGENSSASGRAFALREAREVLRSRHITARTWKHEVLRGIEGVFTFSFVRSPFQRVLSSAGGPIY